MECAVWEGAAGPLPPRGLPRRRRPAHRGRTAPPSRPPRPTARCARTRRRGTRCGHAGARARPRRRRRSRGRLAGRRPGRGPTCWRGKGAGEAALGRQAASPGGAQRKELLPLHVCLRAAAAPRRGRPPCSCGAEHCRGAQAHLHRRRCSDVGLAASGAPQTSSSTMPRAASCACCPPPVPAAPPPSPLPPLPLGRPAIPAAPPSPPSPWHSPPPPAAARGPSAPPAPPAAEPLVTTASCGSGHLSRRSYTSAFTRVRLGWSRLHVIATSS